MDAHGILVRNFITEGTRADCEEAVYLIESISVEDLLADQGYDTNNILAYEVSASVEAVISPEGDHREQDNVNTTNISTI